MSGSKLNNYSSTDNNITQMQLTEDASYLAEHNIYLTNWSTTSLPAIGAGSIVECNGSLYKFSTEEVIGGSTADGTKYVKVVPTSSLITAEFTTTTPVWRDSLHGWYESTSSNDRVLNFKIILSSGEYTKEESFIDRTLNATISADGDEIIFNSSVTFNSGAAFGAGSVAGFLDDGTPFYIKTIDSMQYLSTSVTYLRSSHGLTSPKTNENVISLNFIDYDVSSNILGVASSVAGEVYFEYSTTNPDTIRGLFIDDTYIYKDGYSPGVLTSFSTGYGRFTIHYTT